MGRTKRRGVHTLLLTLIGRLLLPLTGPNLRKEYLGFDSSCLGEDYVEAWASEGRERA